jgi:hypothetical protein
MSTQLSCATPVSTVVFPVVISADTRVAVVGSECGPIGTINEILVQLSSTSAIREIGSRTKVGNCVVDELIFGFGEIETSRLADHLL